MDHYELLGIPRTATRKEIKNAYKKMANKTHPDKPTGNAETHKALTIAYNVLSDEDKRAKYDRGEDPTQGSAPERWEILITSLFDFLIGEDFRGNLIKEAKARAISAKSDQQGFKSEAEQQVRAFTKRLGRVTAEGEINRYEALLSQKIDLLTDRIGKCREEMDALARVILELSNYKDTKPDPKPEGPWAGEAGGLGGAGGFFNNYRGG